MALGHDNIKECVQSETLGAIKMTLESFSKSQSDLVRQGERTAVALETIAEQGAMVANHEKSIDRHEKRLEKHDDYIGEAFKRLRDIEKKGSLEDGISTGKRIVINERRGGIAEKVKLSFVNYIPLAAFFLIWLIEKCGVFIWIAKSFREMKGE